MEQNSTRKSIILLLKKNGGMSINSLSRHLKITPMGVRQHLLALEKKGYVTYLPQKHGIGRPVFVYRLAEEAEKLFPKSYDQFALDILRNIEKYDGTVDIETIFMWRKNSFLKKCDELLQDTTDLVERIHLLKGILESEGHLVDISRNNGSYYLISYNCPISKIAVEFQVACGNELEMYKELITPQATIKQTQAEGNVSCIVEFPLEN